MNTDCEPASNPASVGGLFTSANSSGDCGPVVLTAHRTPVCLALNAGLSITCRIVGSTSWPQTTVGTTQKRTERQPRQNMCATELFYCLASGFEAVVCVV
jgi:hypothetical protein